MTELLDYLNDLYNIISDGIVNFVDFIISVPELYELVITSIPEPFYSFFHYFISIIFFLVVAYAISKIVSIVKGG